MQVFKAPPLKRMMHVYGTGLHTHWSFIYRSLHGVEIKEDGPCSLGIELDSDADQSGDRNYKLKVRNGPCCCPSQPCT
jgi:hypothetical protein